MKSSNQKMRQKNIKKIFLSIKSDGPITKRDIQDKTGLGWATISVSTKDLMEQGHISLIEKSDTAVGRRPELLDINSMESLLCGIDFNSNGVLGVVTDLKGRIQSKCAKKLTIKTREAALEVLCSVLDEFLEQYGDKIRRIALGMQGDVDIETGTSVRIVHIENWTNVPLKQMLEDKYGIPTLVIHDPDCMMQAENVLGKMEQQALSNVLLVNLNEYGIGMSVLTDGKIRCNQKGMFGEIDRTIVAPDSDRIFLAHHCDGKGIQDDYELLKGERVSLEEIIGRAETGEEESCRLFSQYAKYLGISLVNAITLFNLEVVILRGTLSRCFPLFLNELSEFVKKNTYNKHVQLRISNLGDFACANGAALFAADMEIEEICDNI